MKREQERQLENTLVGPSDSSSISTLLVLQLAIIILECHCMLAEGQLSPAISLQRNHSNEIHIYSVKVPKALKRLQFLII